MKNQYAVIGLGRFGSGIVNTLLQHGNEVLVIDMNEERINQFADIATHAVIADSTNDEALKAIGIGNFDTVIVAIGNDMQSSILTTLVLSELKIKKIVAKALNKRHGEVLKKIGADWVIYPEKNMGERVAHQLMSPNVLNFIELAQNYSIEEIKLPSKMVGKSLKELNIRVEFNLTVIAIKSEGVVNISPSPDEVIHEGDVLVMIGENRDLHRFSNVE
ncbi:MULTISPECIES: TrkA family potassium uptake protein [unclassified Bacillus (in: firmicutes)]|uniref:potassium channel family protein n=1 Tax=unclassified Bacillus (in: firmicutes) TaxID=185979 RepID=UPI0008E30992|nr:MULTISPECIES: TrkA family potassium uptake protein [unclassified Bacillus (in: firmicutes)]PFH87661.1 TrkA family potassium uptake protein [Bacillus sp. AFS088145]SFC69057.1 trk system potassium uptake protein TrkA [Bacillus sp. UNCCL81]